MTDLRDSRASSGTFVVDGAYFHAQAREAVRGFFLPLSGVIHAITGTREVKVVHAMPGKTRFDLRYQAKKKGKGKLPPARRG